MMFFRFDFGCWLDCLLDEALRFISMFILFESWLDSGWLPRIMIRECLLFDDYL